MPVLKQLILMIVVISFLTSCKKQSKIEDTWFTSIASIGSKSYSESTLIVDYDFSGNEKDRKYGVFYGENPAVTYGNGTVVEFESSTKLQHRKIVDLTELTGETTYYVQSYIDGDTGLILSEKMKFKTPSLPDLECSYEPSEMDFGFTTVSFGDLVLTKDDEFWYLKADGGAGNGEISFKFEDKPQTLVYDISENPDYASDNHVFIEGQMPEPNECSFNGRHYDNNPIQVVKNEDGKYKIEFCDIILTTCPGGYKMSGHLKN